MTRCDHNRNWQVAMGHCFARPVRIQFSNSYLDVHRGDWQFPSAPTPFGFHIFNNEPPQIQHSQPRERDSRHSCITHALMLRLLPSPSNRLHQIRLHHLFSTRENTQQRSWHQSRRVNWAGSSDLKRQHLLSNTKKRKPRAK
jgi:hypothetical protein